MMYPVSILQLKLITCWYSYMGTERTKKRSNARKSVNVNLVNGKMCSSYLKRDRERWKWFLRKWTQYLHSSKSIKLRKQSIKQMSPPNSAEKGNHRNWRHNSNRPKRRIQYRHVRSGPIGPFDCHLFLGVST